MKINYFFKKLLFCFITTLFFSNIINAQISYDGNILNFGGAPTNGRYNFLVDKFSGLYWTCNNGVSFLQFDVATANPRIAGTGNKIVFYNSFSNTYNSIQVANVYNNSDERTKTNINSIDNGLNTILSLRPVSYNWKSNIANTKSRTNDNTQSIPTGPEEGKTQYGFLAQDVEKILPDAVITDDNGYKLINYTAIIPHLVQSVQELQGVVAEQETIIENLSSQLSSNGSNIVLNKIINCSPNPTSGIITFEYTLTEATNLATIFVTDLTGSLKESFDCYAINSSITKDLSTLKDGIYIATLSVDGEVQDSKQFIIRK